MRALVISGGGSKGAFAGGVAEYLLKVEKMEYDIFVGSSTGSLLAPSLANGQVDKLEEGYTSVKQKDIYSVSPFSVKINKKGERKTRINHFNTLKMFLKKKKTFGESKALRKTIENFLTKEDFEAVKKSRKQVIVTVSNLTTHKVEYKYLKDHSYSDYLDWMWASTCFVPFMSIVEKDGFEYADGGFGNYIPLEAAIDAGATEIDVIILQPKHRHIRKSQSRNPFDVILNCIDFMLQQISVDDIYIGQLESIYNPNIKLRFFYTPRVLTEQSFWFDPKEMKAWWLEGYESAKKKLNKASFPNEAQKL